MATRRVKWIVWCGLLASVSAGAQGQHAPVAAPAPAALPAVTVRALPQAVPVWEFERNGKTLRILGTLSPALPDKQLPKEAITREVARAQAVLTPIGLRITANPGLFQMALMLPGMRKVDYNPDDKTLADILPPADLARWNALRDAFLKGDRNADRFRPVVASDKLFEAAAKRTGLTASHTIERAVFDIAKDRDIPIESAAYNLTLDKPREALKAYNASTMDDVACLRMVMGRVERELPTLADRADAWAVGDLETLRTLPVQDHFLTCMKPWLDSAVAKFVDLKDVEAKVDDTWHAMVLKSLAKHDRVLALVPIDRMLDNTALADRLAREGFKLVSAPTPAP
ncbi:GumN protein [Lysobacter helvus]|uniref:GumN protein n=2 Tax=Lysobacteraceae TaxID=32033 RepID=A0ABN6FR10_9GAMM|nr:MULTISPECIES: TraB/GumN family protein [Lysobacter]BCT92096.1 GumN protein [Lysobacter caseinilyticus]BCT95249.1 GumN protein [Lysobacter helvus]